MTRNILYTIKSAMTMMPCSQQWAVTCCSFSSRDNRCRLDPHRKSHTNLISNSISAGGWNGSSRLKSISNWLNCSLYFIRQSVVHLRSLAQPQSPHLWACQRLPAKDASSGPSHCWIVKCSRAPSETFYYIIIVIDCLLPMLGLSL